MKIRVEVSDEDLGRALIEKVLDMVQNVPGAHHVFPYPYDFRTSGNLVCLVKKDTAYWLAESEEIATLVDAANVLIHGEIRTWE